MIEKHNIDWFESGAVDVRPLGLAAGGAVLWRYRGKLVATIVAKATFAFVPDGPMRLVEPDDIVLEDAHHEGDRRRSLRAASEIAPYLTKADVTLVGHAYSPPGEPEAIVPVRLAVHRDAVVLDKSIVVTGDRVGGATQPFSKMPLVYERAFGGELWAENPAGVGAAEPQGARRGGPTPNLVHPGNPRQTACFGPIAPAWPARASFLRGEDPRALRGRIADVPDEFQWMYFQSAPADQQISFLRGDEWILLEGMNPSLARLRTQLPQARAEGRVHGMRGHKALYGKPLAMNADTLVIDVDREVCSVTWRAGIPVATADELRDLCVFIGIEIAGQAPPWPKQAPPRSAPRSSDGENLLVESVDPDGLSGAASEDGATLLRALDDDVDEVEADDDDGATLMRDVEAESDGTLMLSPSQQALSAALQSILPFVPEATAGGARAPSPLAMSVPPRPRTPADDLDGTMAMSSNQQINAAIKGALPFGGVAAPAPIPAPIPAPAPVPAIQIDEPGPSAEPAPAVNTAQFFHSIPSPATDAQTPLDAPIPERQGDVVPFVFESTITPQGSLAAFTIPWQLSPPKDSLTIVLKATFDINDRGALALRPEADAPSGDVHADNNRQKSLVYPSDFVVFKAKADVVLVGSARAPGGSASRSEVRLRVGDPASKGFERVLKVFGERVWQRAMGPTEPLPFEVIALTYENAFGGPGFDANPIGVGYAPKGASIGALLPNLEDGERLLVAPTDAPPPACFGPIPMYWRERWSKLGTFDARWFKERWPYFPEDTSPAVFQAAPPAQQMEAVEGDEAFEISGVRPLGARLAGALPGLRTRVFAQRTRAAGGEFFEVVMRLDTVVFDTDSMRCSLVWRGLAEVASDDAKDLAAFFVVAERVSDPKAPLAEIRDRFFGALARRTKEATPDAPRDRSAEEAEERRKVREQGREDAARARDQDARVAAEMKRLRDSLRGKGINDEELNRMFSGAAAGAAVGAAAGAAAAPPPRPDPNEIAARLRRAGANEPEIASIVGEIERSSRPSAEPAAQNTTSQDGRARAVAMLAAGESFERQDFAGSDLSDLDFTGRSLAGACLKGCSLKRSKLDAADLTMANLSGADLSEASLTGARAPFVSMVGSALRGANLRGASLKKADLSEAHGEAADLRGINGAGASFARGLWTGAAFDEANLDKADLSGALLDDASLKNASLTDVQMHEARGESAAFDGAKMPGARAGASRFVKGSFVNVEAPGSMWGEADLNFASFHGAKLKGATFLRTSLEGANLSAADLREVRLDRAKLGRASLVKSDLMAASLQQAELDFADLRGANLYSCNTWKATFVGARLEGAVIAKSTLKARG